MVSLKLFSFLIVFIVVLLGESNANSQVMETILAAGGSHDLQPARKNVAKLKEAFDAAPTAAEARNSRLEDRKTKLKWGYDKKTETVEDAKISDYQSIGKNRHKWPTGFTAFAADYHVPKSHPPKHN